MKILETAPWRTTFRIHSPIRWIKGVSCLESGSRKSLLDTRIKQNANYTISKRNFDADSNPHRNAAPLTSWHGDTSQMNLHSDGLKNNIRQDTFFTHPHQAVRIETVGPYSLIHNAKVPKTCKFTVNGGGYAPATKPPWGGSAPATNHPPKIVFLSSLTKIYAKHEKCKINEKMQNQ